MCRYLGTRRPRPGVEPHGEIVEVLAVTVSLFTNSDPARPSENPIDLCDDPLGLIEELVITKLLGKRDQKNNPKRIRPKIAEAAGAKCGRPSSNSAFQNIVSVLALSACVATTL